MLADVVTYEVQSPRLTRLRAAAAEDLRIPAVLHSRMEQASCRACLDAYPTSARVIDDERLGVDTALCEGCGL